MVISISRQVGSGGHEIAELVAKQLGYQLFDRELMAKLGFEAGLTAKGELIDLTAEEHHTQTTRERFFSFTPMTETLALGAYEASGLGDADRSYQLVSKIILIAYQQGNVVVEGRGGQGVLRDKPDVLQVRVVAPLAQRIQYVMKRDNIISDDARKKVKQADASQADYIRKYFGADIDDPTLYHLMINTRKLSVEAAAKMIVAATT